jgi:hypothetical protein
MYTPSRIPRFAPGFAVILMISVILAAQPVAALTVENPKILSDVNPGQTYRFPLAVSISPDETATDLAIDVLGFGQSPAGSYTPLSAADDIGPFSARSYVTIEIPLLHLDPGQRKAFNATVTIPENVDEGGRYALISIHPAPGGKQGRMSTAVTVPVLLTIQGTILNHTGSITDVQMGEVGTGRPIEIQTTLRNTGNHHYYGALVNVTFTDSGGNVVATSSTTTGFALIPGMEATIKTPISVALAPGIYMVTSEARIAEGMVLLDSKTVPLTIEKAYVPPFQETAVDLVPDKEATLATPGGEVTISFPAGSVLAPVHVTVKPVAGTLPQVPSPATAGPTSLSVEGLTGLLSADATVTVRFTADDLAAAGGNPSRLYLARWDAGKNQWTFLPTTVDSVKKTLTVMTNQLGAMEVVSSPQPPAGAAAAPAKFPWPDAMVSVAVVSTAILLWSRKGRR